MREAQVAQLVRNTMSNCSSSGAVSLLRIAARRGRGGRAQLTVKCWTPQGSSSSFSKDTAQLRTLFTGPDSPPGVPGRLELLPPQPRADMFSSAAEPGYRHTPFISKQTLTDSEIKLRGFSAETHFSRTDMLE